MKCSVTRFKVHRNAPTDVQAVRASKETPVTPNQSMTAHRKRRKGTSKPSRREAGADAKTKSSPNGLRHRKTSPYNNKAWIEALSV